MTREEAIKIIKSATVYTPEEMDALEVLIPELHESKDERIRKDLIVEVQSWEGIPESKRREYIAYLEKQKEQKPDDDPLNDPKFLKGFDTGREVQRIFDEKKPAEWSEEDEYRRQQAINALDRNGYYVLVDWLKSLRPQSKDEIYKEKDEAFKFGKHQLAINFINYLDENRPEGKMSLSSDECEDIVRAFKENDWAKIMRYVEKYRPSWKPSEEQMEALLNAEKYLNAGLQYGSATRIAELYEQLKKL